MENHRIMAPKAASARAQEIQAELLLEMEQERLFSEVNLEQRWIGMESNSNSHSHQISEAGFPTNEDMFETWNYGKKAKNTSAKNPTDGETRQARMRAADLESNLVTRGRIC